MIFHWSHRHNHPAQYHSIAPWKVFTYVASFHTVSTSVGIANVLASMSMEHCICDVGAIPYAIVFHGQAVVVPCFACCPLTNRRWLLVKHFLSWGLPPPCSDYLREMGGTLRNEVGTVEGKKRSSSPVRTCVAIQSIPVCRRPDRTCYSSVTQARYLGVVLSANRILECNLKNRQMSHASLRALRNAKLIYPSVDPSYAKMVYRTLIESKMDYATFLCPSITDALHAFDCLLQRYVQCCLGIRVRQSQIPLLPLVFNIDSLGIRRRTLANAFARRLMSTLDDDNETARQKLQAKKTQIALNASEAFQRIVPLVTKPLRKDQTMSMRQSMGDVIIRNMRRPVPVSTRLPPAVQLKSMKHRALACRWHLGVFPVHYRYLSSIGLTCTWMTRGV